MDLIVQLHQWAAERGQKIRMSFYLGAGRLDRVPFHDLSPGQAAAALAAWTLPGALEKHSQIMFGRKYGVIGWLSYPF